MECSYSYSEMIVRWVPIVNKKNSCRNIKRQICFNCVVTDDPICKDCYSLISE